MVVASHASAQKDMRETPEASNLLQFKKYQSEVLNSLSFEKSDRQLLQGLNAKDLAVPKQGSPQAQDISKNISRGGHDGNGGDVACDAKIQTISNDIRLWIENHGPEVGKLDLSSSVYPGQSRPYKLSEYQESMLDLFKLPLDSSCVTEGDSGYPVKVGDNSKICVTWRGPHGLRMQCDQVKFLALDPDSQIEQLHHEFASHVPGLEPADGPISSYKISQQLSAYTQDVIERRLVVTPGRIDSSYPQSAYQVLKADFEKAGPASMEDFPSVADFGRENLNLVCAFVWGPDSEIYESYTNRFGRVDFKFPAQGPSFPEKTISAIAPALRYDASYNDTNEAFAHYFKDSRGRILIKTATNSDGDLQTDYISNEDAQKKSRSHFVFRKQGKFLYVRGLGEVSYKNPYASSSPKTQQIDLYGYCYPIK